MKKKQIIIILISMLGNLVSAKNAPQNTFRFDSKINPLSDNTLIKAQIEDLQSKAIELKDSMPANPLFKKIQEFRIQLLENKIEKVSKEESKDNN